MLESTLTKEEIEMAKKNVSEIKGKMNTFFNSKIWVKLAPVVTMVYGDRKRESLNMVDFVDNVICTLSNIYSKFGYNIGYSTIENIFSDIAIDYYYNMLKIDVNEGAYFDQYSFNAINSFIISLDKDDIKVLDPIFDKLTEIVEK